MASSRFADFLFASFAALQRELPAIHAEMCRILSPRQVALQVDRELVPMQFDPNGARLLDRCRHPAIEVRTSRAEIVALIDADTTLFESALGERLILKGSITDLVVFYDGLLAYLHGAVRAPSFPQLLRRFRLASRHRHEGLEARP